MLPWEADDDELCVVHVIRYAEVGLFKVGISKASTVRPAQLAKAGRAVADLARVKNRTLVWLIESEYLVRVHDHAAEPPLWIAQWAGATEFWREFRAPAADRGHGLGRRAAPACLPGGVDDGDTAR
jgi:hypothetical protein